MRIGILGLQDTFLYTTPEETDYAGCFLHYRSTILQVGGLPVFVLLRSMWDKEYGDSDDAIAPDFFDNLEEAVANEKSFREQVTENAKAAGYQVTVETCD